jgi:Recombination endonuclease VII
MEAQSKRCRRRRAAGGKSVGDREAARLRRGPSPDGHKWCSDCQAFQPFAAFPRNRATKDRYATYCKPHQYARVNRSREKVHGGSRHYHLVRRYGIGAVDVEALITRQGGACIICLRALGQKPHVDHDHTTGEVRGVLCFNCNGGLGQFRDDKEVLLRAVRYLDGGLAS